MAANDLKVTITGKKMTIEIEMQDPAPSKSGKTMVLATTGGNIITNAKYKDKPVVLGLTAYYKP